MSINHLEYFAVKQAYRSARQIKRSCANRVYGWAEEKGFSRRTIRVAAAGIYVLYEVSNWSVTLYGAHLYQQQANAAAIEQRQGSKLTMPTLPDGMTIETIVAEQALNISKKRAD